MVPLPIIKTIDRRERPTGSIRGVSELAKVCDGEFVRLGSSAVTCPHSANFTPVITSQLLSKLIKNLSVPVEKNLLYACPFPRSYRLIRGASYKPNFILHICILGPQKTMQFQHFCQTDSLVWYFKTVGGGKNGQLHKFKISFKSRLCQFWYYTMIYFNSYYFNIWLFLHISNLYIPRVGC